MIVYPYSLARQTPVDLAEVQTLLGNEALSREDYYRACIDIFPLIMGEMTQTEITGQQSLKGFKRDQVTSGSRFSGMEQLRQAGAIKTKSFVAASLLPDQIDGFPLLDKWRDCGRSLYGTDGFVFINEASTLRRDAMPTKNVIGPVLHRDSSLGNCQPLHQLSIFSICGDPVLETFHAASNDGFGPWWSTHWADMRGLKHAVYELLCDNITHPNAQQYLYEHCAVQPLPPHHHIAMPTWMLHKAGGLEICPLDYAAVHLPRQPKALVSHVHIAAPVQHRATFSGWSKYKPQPGL